MISGLKRDDLSGLGGGGNKTRKLEWTIGQALADGGDTLVTTGSAQSNRARLTAAAGARLGLEVVLVFPGSPGGLRSGNLVLDGLFGGRIAWAGDVDQDGLAAAATSVPAFLRESGSRSWLIPCGGSNAVGAPGYVLCGQELTVQMPDLETVVVAAGSRGTMAGLVASLGTGAVLGVDTGALEDPLSAVAAMASEVGKSVIHPEQLRSRLDMVGTDYGDLTADD